LIWNKTVLALGADIKNRILLARGNALYVGRDLGDLSEVKNFSAFKKEVAESSKIARPDIIAYDLHPNYFSSLFAKTCQLTGAPRLLPVQHHHAHIASVMQEHDLNKPVIGISFDGTGFGLDGNSWGGEFLLVDKRGLRRLAHLKYRMMPGADKVVFEPWRMALSILGREAFTCLKGIGEKEKELTLAMIEKKINTPLTSSAGRLFDAASALLGICLRAAYEAEGPIKLEELCAAKITADYPFAIVKKDSTYIIDSDEVFFKMLQDLKKKVDKEVIAAKFHNSIVEIIIQTVKRLSRSLKIKDVALSGGVFQNNYLSQRAIKRLRSLGLDVFINQHAPVNDLNISLGQYYVSCRTGKG
jgi:hydrogenase maturation protein HypF